MTHDDPERPFSLERARRDAAAELVRQHGADAIAVARDILSAEQGNREAAWRWRDILRHVALILDGARAPGASRNPEGA